MIPFSPPLTDIRYLLTRLVGIGRLATLPGYEQLTTELTDAVLEEAAKIASEKFAPLNDASDRAGAKFERGRVIMPPGCKQAYQAFIDGGWNSLPVETEHGGQGLPWSLAMGVQDMLQASNVSLALCTLLNQGTVETVATHCTQDIKAKFLAKLVSGEWTGTMNLTEPQAGSDVGAIKSKATKEGDHYRILGQKIFISYGDHDLTTNIVHLVLARTPNAPEGTKGLSLFLVPKIILDDDGELKNENDIRVVSIEHKLGQHASPTCVMAFGDNGGALGYLVGQENGGMAAMFTMMNNARIGVGIQALGLMERAYQQARDFANTRVQGRKLHRSREKGAASDPLVPIIHHPDVRRMLLWMKSHIEASRALAYSTAYAIDVSKHAATETERRKAEERVDLLTPVVKAWLTDLSNEVTSMAVQVFGGMGFVEETGVAQHMRDARVLAIYEGTNGIQANDLVFRKLGRDNGAAFMGWLEEATQLLQELNQQAGDDFAAMHTHLSMALTALHSSANFMLKKLEEDPVVTAAVAVPFARLMGNAAGGMYLFKTALCAQEDLAMHEGDAQFLAAKIITARFYAEHVLPQCGALAVTVKEGSTVVMSMPTALF